MKTKTTERFHRPASAPWRLGMEVTPTYSWDERTGAWLTLNLGRLGIRTYARRVALHEAGHFLTAYLLGLLPRVYTLSAWDAFTR